VNRGYPWPHLGDAGPFLGPAFHSA
jgi:hypothetical protein